MICGIEFVAEAVKLGRGLNDLSFWWFDTRQRNRNNISSIWIHFDFGFVCLSSFLIVTQQHLAYKIHTRTRKLI